jgi:hypothetical protein
MDRAKTRLDKLMCALESRANRDFDEFYFDKQTGDVLSADLAASNDPELLMQIETHTERYILVKPLPPQDIDLIIDNFLQRVGSSDSQKVLKMVMLEGASFRDFKEAVSDFPEIEEVWNRFLNTELETASLEWLAKHQVKLL